MTTVDARTIDEERPAGDEVAVTLGRGRAGDPLDYRQARRHPCFECQTSPCCTYLLLRDFRIDTLLDVDYALFLLNFEGIYLGFLPDRKVDVYLYQPCGNLDTASGLCQVHSTPLQPAVCVHYSSHSCGYRQRMVADVDTERPILDYRRMTWLAEHLVFDDDRRVIGGPQWQDMLDAFGALPLDRRPAPAPGPDPVVEEWKSIVLTAKEPAHQPHRWTDSEVTRPCESCGAWCCQKLVFNRGLPNTASQMEFLRYCLGFPSVEVGVAADGWAVIVTTRCRHLDGTRCSVYGSEERPLRCQNYDALACEYRTHFGEPRPEEMVRVSRDQFGLVADSLVYDHLGRVVAIPPVDVMRSRLESALVDGRAGGPVAPSPA